MVQHPSIRHRLALALWRSSFAHPAATMFALASGKHRDFFDALISLTSIQNVPTGDDLKTADIEVQVCRVANRPVALIRIPPPNRCPDPHMIAIVINKQLRGDVRKSDLEGSTVEYFTLEQPPDLPGGPLTYLCSTDVNGAHHNHGAGPTATFDEFRKILTQIFEPPPWWQFWRGRSTTPARKPRCPQCNGKLEVGSQSECKKCKWLRYPSDRSRWDQSGACPGCGFSYRFDGENCSHCGLQANSTTATASGR